MLVIQAQAVTRGYAPGRGVFDLHLEVHAGECVGVGGRNGAGKTTLTRLVAGLDSPQDGCLTVFGSPAERRRHLRRTGVALDRAAHWDRLTGWQNACFVAEAFGVPRAACRQRLEGLFSVADLVSHAHDPVSSYSYGMRRKLLIIEALCSDPDLLVLDEPTAGVDAAFASGLLDVVRRRRSAGQTTWIASNDLDWVESACGRVVLLRDGEKVADGSPSSLVARVACLQEIVVTPSGAASVSRPSFGWVKGFAREEGKVVVLTDPRPELLPELIGWLVGQGVRVEAIEVRRPRLKDALLVCSAERTEP